ncbi:MAG: hypothetical protein K1W01_06835 [Muribaculaceae bacterium]
MRTLLVSQSFADGGDLRIGKTLIGLDNFRISIVLEMLSIIGRASFSTFIAEKQKSASGKNFLI